ncbi:MAG: hypothetical protein JNL83_25510 [Myxococcales bacterium]|nr:hypothetical protein [Myxococcales bacterium]
MSAGYIVQVLVSQYPGIDPYALHGRLLAWKPDVALVGGTSDRVWFAVPTEDLPVAVEVSLAPPEVYAQALCDALTWTPRWEDGWATMAERYHASIVVAMRPQRQLNHASLLLGFLAVLDAVLASLDDEERERAVLHWMPAQQLLTYARYRDLRMDLGPCGPAVNIRIANATGRPGELLADTVGLADLGLPDLQTVVRGEDPADVLRRMRVLVSRLFVGARLGCAWMEEDAMVPPMRETLTLKLDRKETDSW